MVAVVRKQEFHRVTPLRETGLVRRCTQVSAKRFLRVTAASNKKKERK